MTNAQTSRPFSDIGNSGGNKRITNNVDVATSAFETGMKIFNSAKSFWREKFQYHIVISDTDPFYWDVLDWISEVIPEDKSRLVTVRSQNESYNTDVHSSETPVSPREKENRKLIIRPNISRPRSIKVNGYPALFYMAVPDINPSSNATNVNFSPETKLEFFTNSFAAHKAVLDKLQEIYQKNTLVRAPNLKMVSHWGSWSTRADLPPRTMDSIALPLEQKNRIVNDLKSFISSEDKYNSLGIPWHRGYMLYGPPGTGKTSLVKALANEFRMDLWYISLSDLKAESSLINLIGDVQPRSILLLEDIDTVRITHDRDASVPGTISMSALLNTLDGVATPHGLITFMTTNRFDILDPALTRAGRMDLIEELGYPTLEIVAQMFTHFYGRPAKWMKKSQYQIMLNDISTSDIAEIMKRHMFDPKKASDAIFDKVKDRLG